MKLSSNLYFYEDELLTKDQRKQLLSLIRNFIKSPIIDYVYE